MFCVTVCCCFTENHMLLLLIPYCCMSEFAMQSKKMNTKNKKKLNSINYEVIFIVFIIFKCVLPCKVWLSMANKYHSVCIFIEQTFETTLLKPRADRATELLNPLQSLTTITMVKL